MPRARSHALTALLLLAALALFIPLLGCRTASSDRLDYPPARRGDQVDHYHGVAVADPYRWLEDPDSAETRAWIEAENALTERFLAEIPERERIRARLTELWDHERRSVPVERGGRLFFDRNDGLQPQPVLHVVDRAGAAPRPLIDPNALPGDGTISLANWTPSPDGRLVAYALSDGGSDWRTWRVRDVETGADLPDTITRNKFGGLEWDAESAGFYYARYERPAPGEELRVRNAPAEICHHRLGTSESADVVLVERPPEGFTRGFEMSEDRRSLFLSTREVASRNNDLAVLPLAAPGVAAGEPRPIVRGFGARTSVVGDDGSTAWLLTNDGAPRWRIVAVDLGAAAAPAGPTGLGDARTIVPEGEEPIESARSAGGKLFVTTLRHAVSVVRVFEPDGTLRDTIALTGIGSARGFGGEADDTHVHYAFTSFARPSEVHRYDIAKKQSERWFAPEVPFDPGEYRTEQVFYESKDGTRVPMFLTYRAGTRKDGDRPVVLYGYGGFGSAQTPSFRAQNLLWLELGGVLAVPGLRGGDEYGEEWHAAGTKERKQNVFDDAIAAAEWLIENDWTRPERLAISGRSNGGLLVGACLTQRPDLFGAALPAVGVLDMLRYHEFTIGWAWAGDYGTAEDESEFHALHAYSPLHSLVPGRKYPATLITTAERDDRVVPAHSFKFAAALQAAQGGTQPALIRVETRAGHGAGRPTAMEIEEEGDKIAFLLRVLGVGRSGSQRAFAQSDTAPCAM